MSGETLDLREIVHRLGGNLYAGGRNALVPGPGHSRKDRSLSLTLVEGNPPRILWKSWANDPGEAVWPYLGIDSRTSRPMSRAEAERARKAREAERRRELAIKLAFCREVWARTVPAIGSPVETYLRGRGIVGPVPGTLRFHSAAPWGYPDPTREVRTFPAMVAIATAPDGRNAAGLHLTALKPDGQAKAAIRSPRLMFGDLIGAAVQLGPLPEGGDLVIAEGIETALSYRDLTGTPAWAALSTSGLRRFIPPAGIKCLIVAADRDDAKGEGIAAANDLAERASRRCEAVVVPAPEGMDFNDVLREARP